MAGIVKARWFPYRKQTWYWVSLALALLALMQIPLILFAVLGNLLIALGAFLLLTIVCFCLAAGHMDYSKASTLPAFVEMLLSVN